MTPGPVCQAGIPHTVDTPPPLAWNEFWLPWFAAQTVWLAGETSDGSDVPPTPVA